MDRKTEKILFIGNSHTYYNDMPFILRFFSTYKPETPILEPIIIAHGGKSLEAHKSEPEVRFNILYGNFQYVVLQQVAHPFSGGKVELLRDAKEINNYIKLSGAKPIAYMTWSEKDKKENQKEMIDAYTELAREINGILSPVGVVWQDFMEKYPGIDLYDNDRAHANAAGSYLTACVFYCIILDASPIGLPFIIKYNDKPIVEIQEETAQKIQTAVWGKLKNDNRLTTTFI